MKSNTENAVIIPFPIKEKPKRVKDSEPSMEYLKEVMGLLILTGRRAGCTEMPRLVCQAFNAVLKSAIKLAEEKYGQDD